MKADDNHALDDVLEQLADGDSIDWEAAARRASTSADQGLLRQLKILEALRDTHRSTGIEGAETMDVTPRRPAITPPADDSRAGGRRWGRYRLVRHIGEGSYGAVYLAHDDELDRDLAIKLLHPKLAARADLTQRVKAEGRALARVHHPHVVAVYDVEEHEQQLGLCMEYVHGRTLDDIVRSDGPMNADEAIAIGQAICRGLAAVHTASVVHRDVKGRNVLRERAGRIVLMDLGAGLDRAQQDAASIPNIGTPVYMAPELFEGESATRRSDLYAVGVLLYFLVSGEYPVDVDTVDEMRRAHRAGRRTRLYERRLDLPEGFLRVVERAIEPDPSRRYESAAALLRDLTGAANVPRPWVRVLQWTAALALAVPAVAVLSGFLTARTFNRILDRPAAFDDATVVSTVVVGFQSLLLPALTLGVIVGAIAVLQLAVGVLPGPRRWWRRARQRWADYLDVPGSERAALLARAVVLGGFIGFFVLWGIFADFLDAYVGLLSEDDLARFAVFRPEHEHRMLVYRLVLPALLFLVALGWVNATRVRRTHGGTIPGSVRVGAIGLACVILVFLQAPYKLMTPANEMPVVTVGTLRCYVLGQRESGTRVFCPGWPVPRVRFVDAATPIEPCGFEENVFHEPRTTGCARGTQPE